MFEPSLRATRWRRSLALATLALITLSCPPIHADEPGPKAVVQQTVQSVIEILDQRSDKTKLREPERAAIRAILKERFDFAEMTRRSIGRAWKGLDPRRRQEFTVLFTQLMEYTYGNRLSSYHGQKIEYDDAEFRHKRARVKSRVIDGDKITPVEYRLRRRGGGWRIYDVKIEGVSLINTFRRDFRSMIERRGIDGLYAALQEKVATLKAKSRD
ncbi:MAG: ABC transporter substrate-binding protein [Zetaproteobacteria bacterium]|nr:MAG: ABC transporter substrate-binding protein [Zetaproteobacteria bacterium]